MVVSKMVVWQKNRNKNKTKQATLRTNRPDLLSSFQTLAIYDRFGRLMYGQEDVPKDVLEYVVFEKHLVNPYGSWRMHGKIVPPWAPPKQPILKVGSLRGLREPRRYSWCPEPFLLGSTWWRDRVMQHRGRRILL